MSSVAPNESISVWDHLEDLRLVLIRASIVIFVGFVISLFFYQPLLSLLTPSWQRFYDSNVVEQPIARYRVTNHSSQPEGYFLPKDAVLVSDQRVDFEANGSFRIAPGSSLEYELPSKPQLLLLSPLEGLIQTFKICFWLSLTLTFPFWGWLFLEFVKPGLHCHEQAILIPFVVFSIFSIMLGIATAHFATIPLANAYLLAFNSSLGQNAWTFSHYIDYTFLLYFGHAVAFELCLLLLIMVHYRLISSEWLIAKRRSMIVLAFILAALLTPPDVLTQFMMAIPMILIYEFAILYGRRREQ